MNIQKRYEMLSSARVGIEVEFYASMNHKDTAKDLSKFLGKKVIIPVTIIGFDEKDKGKYHSEIEPTSTMFKLEKDFSGGKDMYELITGVLVYEEARIIIIKMLEWIRNNGWTNEKCSIHLNLSFNDFLSKHKLSLMNLNVLKFILGFDEEMVYSRFPERRDSVYAKSIFNIYPYSRFVFFEKPENIEKFDYVVPHEKYFGVNFTKLPKDYLEFRYIGGEDYEKKTSKILELLEYFITQLHFCLINNFSFTAQEKEKLFSILAAQKKAVATFSEPEKFLLLYPNIQVTVDMKGDIEILKAFWVSIREKLFSLIVDSGLREGHFNVDNDISIAQLRDGIMLKGNNISDMELFDCEISGTIENCDLYRCKIKTSRLHNCKLIESNELRNCKVENCTIKAGNILDDCYIQNADEVIDGKVIGGVIRRGILGENADISKSTLIVDVEGYEKKDKESFQNAFNSNKPLK